MQHELKVISDFYDFMLWTMQHTEKFPRHHRYSLGMAIEQRLLAILSLLLRAKYTRDKGVPLGQANLELEVLRFQLRLARDLRSLTVKAHGFASGVMQEIGAQIGGWLKSNTGNRSRP